MPLNVSQLVSVRGMAIEVKRGGSIAMAGKSPTIPSFRVGFPIEGAVYMCSMCSLGVIGSDPW